MTLRAVSISRAPAPGADLPSTSPVLACDVGPGAVQRDKAGTQSCSSGSLRFAYELEIPDLSVRPIARFPYLVFYVIGEDVVDVWRVLHTKREIPSAIVGDLDD